MPLVQIDWQGKVSFVGGASYSATPKIVQKQYALLENSKRFKVASDLISQKMKHSMDVIKAIKEVVKAHGTKKTAKKIGISDRYLRILINGNKKTSETVTNKFLQHIKEATH